MQTYITMVWLELIMFAASMKAAARGGRKRLHSSATITDLCFNAAPLIVLISQRGWAATRTHVCCFFFFPTTTTVVQSVLRNTFLEFFFLFFF